MCAPMTRGALCLAATALLGCAPAAPPAAGAGRRARDRAHRVALVEVVEDTFRHRYAPLEHKRRAGWDLEAELTRLRAVLLAEPPPSDAAVRRALYEFFRSPRDVHTSIDFEEPRGVWLGLHIRGTDDGYRVAWIDRNVFPPGSVPIDVGDRVLTFDRVEIERAVLESGEETMWRSTPAFDRAFAEWFLVFRSTTEWRTVPRAGDEVLLEVEHAGATIPVRVAWRDLDAERGEPPARRCPFWGHTERTYVPELGRIVWRQDDSRLIAYVAEREAREIGYLRFPTYRASEAQLTIRTLDSALTVFSTRRVAAVVIDQTGNGGGSFPFALAMLSRLSATPLVAPQQRFLRERGGGLVGFPGRAQLREMAQTLRPIVDDASAREAFRSLPLLRDHVGYLSPRYQSVVELRDYLSFLADPQPSSHARLTDARWQVVQEYRSDEDRGPPYTGPLVMIIDEMNISAAEYVAAAFADAGRATLLGVTTAGAGGDQRTLTVDRVCGERAHEDPFALCTPEPVARAMRRYGIAAMSFTVTLGVRFGAADGRLIENVGVAPHVPYRIGADDLRSGYAPLRRAIWSALAR